MYLKKRTKFKKKKIQCNNSKNFVESISQNISHSNLKEPFFDYRKGENVFELTTNVFSLIDHLHAANPSLEPTQYIEDYFLFRF